MNWDEMGVGLLRGFNEEGSKQYQQEQANQALAEIMNEFATQQEGMELPPGVELNPMAQQQQTAGRAGLQAVLNNPNLKRLDTSRVSSALTPFLGMINKPVEYAGKEWDKRQTQQENQALRAQSAQELQAQKAQDRQAEIAARDSFIKQVQAAVAQGHMTEDEGKQAVAIKFGLQPRAQNQPNEMEVFEQVTGAPKELRGTPQYEAKYYEYLQKKNPKAFQINVGGVEKPLSLAQQATISGRLRNEMKGNPYVKNFQDVDSKYKVMIQALEEAPKAGTLVAVDQALISLFNKMTDPQSVVRESEYARTGRDMSLLNRLKGKVEKVMSGGAGLTSEERQALVDMGTKFYNTYAGNYNDAINNMNELSTLEGINPKRVNTTYQPAKLREERSAMGGGTQPVKNITQADINATAIKYKMTPQQVKQKLGIR